MPSDRYRAADESNERLDRAPCSRGSQATKHGADSLQSICGLIKLLKIQLEMCGSTSTGESEEETDPIASRMFELAWQAAKMRPNSLEELKSKSEILIEYAEDDPTDLVSSLTLSLAYDILALSTPPDGSRNAIRE